MEKVTPETHSEFKAVVDEEGHVVLKKKSEIAKGKQSKAAGLQFEARVRKDLEGKGWTVDKWSNNIDLETKNIIPAKRVFNPFSKVMTIGTGFPDFICLQKAGEKTYSVIGVEVKINGTLSRQEKEKCRVYLDKQTFGQILVAQKVKKGRNIHIIYKDVNEIMERMR
jgi:hypothetical protein